MKLHERLGELLMVGFIGQEMSAALAAHIRDLQPAGLIFFSRNIRAPAVSYTHLRAHETS